MALNTRQGDLNRQKLALQAWYAVNTRRRASVWHLVSCQDRFCKLMTALDAYLSEVCDLFTVQASIACFTHFQWLLESANSHQGQLNFGNSCMQLFSYRYTYSRMISVYYNTQDCLNIWKLFNRALECDCLISVTDL